MENCIFCKIVKGELPSQKVYENEKILAFKDINPATNGHTLVIPKNHCENIFDIDVDDLIEVNKAILCIIDELKKDYDFEDVNILSNNGKLAGQCVFHYHVHVVPRYENDNFVKGFFQTL